jgi:hypothetical protein
MRGMGRVKKGMLATIRGIPLVDSIVSLLKESGALQFLIPATILIGSTLVTVWAWLISNVPAWGLAIIFIWTAAGLLMLACVGLGVVIRWKAARQSVPIDLQALAKEADELSAAIFALAGEFQGQLNEAWMSDAQDGEAGAGRYRKLETQVIERYSHRYAGDAWRVLHIAAKALNLDPRKSFWGVLHGVRYSGDINEIAVLLSRLAVDLRYKDETI